MLTVLILLLITVWGTDMANSSNVVVADAKMRISERQCLAVVNSNLQLEQSCSTLEVYPQVNSEGYLIRHVVTDLYLAVPNPVEGEALTLNETGTVFTLGGGTCIYETFDNTNPIQLGVEGESGCINDSLVYTEDCESSSWYPESWWDCATQTGEGCKACFLESSLVCKECTGGLALNGRICDECPSGFKADICGRECVEIPSTEAATTDAPEDPSSEDPTTDSSENTTAGGGHIGFIKPMGVMLILASFLLD